MNAESEILAHELGSLQDILNDNQDENSYLVFIDDEEFNIPKEMANNIFIRI